MTVADTAAVKALVQSASTALASRTFVSVTPEGVVQPKPYALLHPAEGDDTASRATGPRSTTNPAFTLHLVSGSAASVQTVVDLVKAKFVTSGLAIAPTVAGRRNQRAYWRQPVAIQTDKSVTPWLLYAVVELGWESDPS